MNVECSAPSVIESTPPLEARDVVLREVQMSVVESRAKYLRDALVSGAVGAFVVLMLIVGLVTL